MALKIIVAVTMNWIIGKDGHIPFKLPDDLKRFKEITTGKAVVMGSKTFQSIVEMRGGPLSNRENIVLTHHPEKFTGWGVTTAQSFGEVLARSRKETIFVIGGAEPYRLSLPYVDEMFITRVQAVVNGDTSFPPWDSSYWSLEAQEWVSAGERNQYSFAWEVWKRM